MARQARVQQPSQHRIRIRDDGDDGELLLVRGGQSAYLWAGPDKGGGYISIISGPATLRALARAILKEVPKPRSRP